MGKRNHAFLICRLGDRVLVRYYRREYPGEVVRTLDHRFVVRFRTKTQVLERKAVVFSPEHFHLDHEQTGCLAAKYVGPALSPSEVVHPDLPDAIP